MKAERLPAFRQAVARGALPAGYAADDGAALLYEGARLVECVASRAGARVKRVDPDGEGGVREREIGVRLLPGAAAGAGAGGAAAGVPGEPVEEPRGVSELRALRAGRHRWD